MCGAAFLAGKAAYHTGSGLVRVLTEACNRICMQTAFCRKQCWNCPGGQGESRKRRIQVLTERDLEGADRAIRWASSICIGPGFGMKPWKKELLLLEVQCSRKQGCRWWLMRMD